MNKSILLLLLYIFKAVYGVEPDPENQKPETCAQESADIDLPPDTSLADIEPHDVLPFITILKPDKYPFHYQMPTNLLKYELTDGKISNGTEFGPREEGDQMVFFCPWVKDGKQEKCLVRQTFKESEALKCDVKMEPTPEWMDTKINCGGGYESRIFESIYKVCARDEYPFDPPFLSFYQICYSIKDDNVLYTSHEIKSAGLLNLNLLTKERSMDYPMLYSRGDITTRKWATTSIEPSYKLQQLVPPEDMAFATWRKTTFSNLNYEKLQKDLIDPWNKISTNIRSVAKKYVASGGKFFVNTAIEIVNEVYGRVWKIWVKMIYVLKSTDGGELKATDGTAILMNNFIESENTAESTNPSLEKYCDQNLCIDELTQEIKKIGSEIRCCRITPEILEIFQIEMGETEEIPIPNVTASENHEILLRPVSLEKAPIPNSTVLEDHETFRDPISLEKAGTSLREIEPREMLPLVLSSFRREGKSIINLLRPEKIIKIETKNRRIAQGSEFTAEAPFVIENKLFCPKRDSDETCLVPVEFGTNEPLQCVKEAIPVVQVVDDTVKCGFEDQGVEREVGYEICPVAAEQSYTFHFSVSHNRFYKFCYDIENKKNLYTLHYISSPRLILSNLLLRERGMNHFDMMEDELASVPDLPLRKRAMNHSDMMEVDSVPVSDPGDENLLREYVLQKLVPPEDMAFGLWKKSTYKHINADWQHTQLKPFWDKINERIRNHILCHIDYYPVEQNPFLDFITRVPSPPPSRNCQKQSSYQIYTSVLDYSTKPENHTANQKSNVWGKIIISNHEAVAIMMNNFLVTKSEESSTSKTTKRKSEVLPGYCIDIPCLEDVKKEIEGFGGRIACCRLTKKFRDRLGVDKNLDTRGIGVLPIRGITIL